MAIKAKDIVTALEANGGLITPTAKALGITYQGLSKRIKNSEALQTAANAILESKIDMAENQLLKKIKEGDNTMIIFFLKCHGKKRGWIERQELDARIIQSDVVINITEDKD